MKVNMQMPLPLTPKQKKALDFINGFTAKHGYAPSLQEIANHFDRPLSSAQHFLDKLEAKGYLKRNPGQSRSIAPIEQTEKIFKLGYIAAGNPIEPIENPEPIDIPLNFMKSGGSYYALEVKGDSMIEDNILDGDTIVIRQQKVAENGDRVVAVTENGATLKVFRRESGQIYLEPRNSKLKPIYPKELEIRGKFVGLIRKT